MTAEKPLLDVTGLAKEFSAREKTSWFSSRTRVVRAVADVSFSLERGDVLGIVGESGSGKTTLSRMVVHLLTPTAGHIRLKGRDMFAMSPDEVRAIVRPSVRMIFQDPDAALNPAYTIGTGLARAIRLQPSRATDSEENVRQTIDVLLDSVGLNSSFADKYPDELSGGEKRRIGMCRALSTDPDIMIADEPLSGLDVVLQERVLELLKREQTRRGFALILVSHDLDRVNQVCDAVMVMHAGRVVEHAKLRRGAAPVREQFRHPYSVMLQQARLDIGGRRALEAGKLGDRALDEAGATKVSRGDGCSFVAACPRHKALANPAVCSTSRPVLTAISQDQSVACHFVEDGEAGVPAAEEQRLTAVTAEK